MALPSRSSPAAGRGTTAASSPTCRVAAIPSGRSGEPRRMSRRAEVSDYMSGAVTAASAFGGALSDGEGRPGSCFGSMPGAATRLRRPAGSRSAFRWCSSSAACSWRPMPCSRACSCRQFRTSAGSGFDLAVAIGVGWLSVGLLRDLLATRRTSGSARRRSPRSAQPARRIGATEVVIALAVVDLLFAAFVAVQARYLFGGQGASRVARAPDLRAVRAPRVLRARPWSRSWLLPLLLVANALVRAPGRGTQIVRGLSAALVGLVLVVMLSALDRMWLYERGYGLTELRIYAIGIILCARSRLRLAARDGSARQRPAVRDGRRRRRLCRHACAERDRPRCADRAH